MSSPKSTGGTMRASRSVELPDNPFEEKQIDQLNQMKRENLVKIVKAYSLNMKYRAKEKLISELYIEKNRIEAQLKKLDGEYDRLEKETIVR